MTKALVVFSGGQDSTTCLYWALKEFDEVEALTINYGQRHKVEIEAAKKIAQLARVKHEIVEVGNILDGTSPLTNQALEVEQYKDAESLPGGLEKTYVPCRNQLFLTIAANRAYVNDCDTIITGVSQEDYGGYPDCRQEFISALETAICYGTDKSLTIQTPLINLNKKQTVDMATSLGPACWKALSYSHTCYNGLVPPCGHCHACLLRQKGFELAGFGDPLLERLQIAHNAENPLPFRAI